MALTSSSFTTINIAYLFIFIWKYVHTQIVVFYFSNFFNNCLKYLLQSLWDIQFMMSVKRQTTSQSLYREIIHCWLRWSQWSLSHQYLIEWSLMLMAEQIFSVFHHCEGGEFLFHTKEKGILKEKRKAPTCGHCAKVGQYALSNTEDWFHSSPGQL